MNGLHRPPVGAVQPYSHPQQPGQQPNLAPVGSSEGTEARMLVPTSMAARGVESRIIGQCHQRTASHQTRPVEGLCDFRPMNRTNGRATFNLHGSAINATNRLAVAW